MKYLSWQLASLDARSPRRSQQQARAGEPDPREGPRALQFRSGGRVLSLFSTTLHGVILRALAEGPVSLSDLRAKAGEPTQKTLRGNIGNLIGIGALERRKLDGGRDLIDNEITPFGRELLFVAEVLDAWLRRSPSGRAGLEAPAAKEAVKALIGGWGSAMLRALAVRALTPSELDGLIASFSRPALERRLSAMRSAGLVSAAPGSDDRAAYAVTGWLRKGVAPLVAAIRCERLYLAAETAPLSRIDVDTLLLLAVPLVGSVDGASNPPSGTCQLAVDVGANQASAGVRVAIERGAIVSCSSKLESSPSEWSGSAAAWLDAIIEGMPQQLDGEGPAALSRALLAGLHGSLFSAS